MISGCPEIVSGLVPFPLVNIPTNLEVPKLVVPGDKPGLPLTIRFL